MRRRPAGLPEGSREGRLIRASIAGAPCLLCGGGVRVRLDFEGVADFAKARVDGEVERRRDPEGHLLDRAERLLIQLPGGREALEPERRTPEFHESVEFDLADPRMDPGSSTRIMTLLKTRLLGWK